MPRRHLSLAILLMLTGCALPDGDVDSLDPIEQREDPLYYTGVTGKSWSSERRECVEAIAVHEFGHALAISARARAQRHARDLW